MQKEGDDETYVNAQIYPNIEAITEYLKGSVPTKEEIWKLISDAVSSVNKKLPNYKHIKNFVIRDNPNYKHIKNFVIRDKEFEKTTTQKVKRYGENLKMKKDKNN